MKPQDFTRFTPDNEEKWLYKDITEKIIGATNDEAQLLNFKLLNYMHMHLTPVTRMSYRLRGYGFTMNVLCKHRTNRHSLLYQSVEQLATGTGCSTIEPKRVFIEVVVEMRRLHPTLVSSQQPALDQGNNEVDLRQHIFADGSVFSDNLVDVAQFGQSPITFPSVCLDSAPQLNTLFNGPFQAGPRRIRYTPEPNSPDLTFFKLYHDNNQRLTRCSSTALPWFLTTYVDLVYLDGTRQTVPARPHHSTPEFVQPRPGCTITAQVKNTLQSQCIRPIFLAGQVPNSAKPKPQRFLSVLKNRTGSNRGLKTTAGTLVQRSIPQPCFLISTVRTLKTFGPAKAEQIIAARSFSAKAFFKLEQGSWIVFHKPTYYSLSLPESSAYANNIICSGRACSTFPAAPKGYPALPLQG